jgi:hypothetical protein
MRSLMSEISCDASNCPCASAGGNTASSSPHAPRFGFVGVERCDEFRTGTAVPAFDRLGDGCLPPL